jgi:LuxR family maltose regulon positive regulatory protein
MVEALSEREREVLSLVAQAMPNKKIARVINVSPETVKWHLKNIFGKLGVGGRDEAVGRARDLKISLVDPYTLEDTKQDR